jgi:hydrogenase maturation protein HypF
LPVLKVFHHHSHAASLAGEYPEVRRWLMFTWDGVGYGADGMLWGGEILWGQPGDWRHVGGLRRFRLPGGERAGREPWRSAAALCWEAGMEWQAAEVDVLDLARQAWQQGLNSPVSSATGRICDAAAALILGIQRTSFEGEGPMRLEAAGDVVGGGEALPLPMGVDDGGVLRVDWSPLLPLLQDTAVSVPERAAIFHNSLAAAAVEQVRVLCERYVFEGVGLTGGVFQNRLLCERVRERLQALGITVYLHERVPCNDGGLSFGQVVEGLSALTEPD